MYQFLGDLTGSKKIPGGVLVETQNGAVMLEFFETIGCRVRCRFDKEFGEVFSYATIRDLPPYCDVKVKDNDDHIYIESDLMEVVVRKNPFRLTFRNHEGLEFLRESFGSAHRDGKKAHFIHKPKETVFYGLGEKNYPLNRTGYYLTNWNTDITGFRAGQDPLYKTFPFYIILDNNLAAGIFYDNPYRSEFDFGARLDDHVTCYLDGGEMRFYVFYGPSVRQVVECYTTLTGRMDLPPAWSLGYHHSRWGYYPDSDVRLLVEEFIRRDIPIDAIHLDIEYMDEYRVFTWDSERFPDPRRLISELREKGIQTVTIVDPGVKAEKGYPVYDEGVQGDHFVKLPDSSLYTGEVWPGRTCFPDFSRPATRKWWAKQQSEMLDQGVTGIWIDMNEPAVFGGKTMPDIVEFDKEGRKADHLEMHNQYALLMAKTTREALLKKHPDSRPFVLTRAAYSGIQRYAAVWTGDNSATWDHLDLSMTTMLGLGLAGVPFAGFDIGGFAGSPDGELYTRSLQIGVFSPFMRTHTAHDTNLQDPWSYGKQYEFINRELVRLRYRFLPHLYTAFYRHTLDGSPVLRPLLWEYQNDPMVFDIDDQFFFGDHIMVAPVCSKNTVDRSVYFPAGTWYNFFSGQKKEGGRRVSIPAALSKTDPFNRGYTDLLSGIPVFVRAGAVIPMQEIRKNIQRGKPVTGPAGKIELKVFDGSAESLLYEDDGQSFNYKKGDFRLTTFRTESTERFLRISIHTEGSFRRSAPAFLIEAPGLSREPAAITLNGKPVPFDPVPGNDRHKLRIRFEIAAAEGTVEIKKR